MSGSKTIHAPNGAFGYTDLTNQLFSTQAEFKTSAAVVATRVVAVGTTGLVATAATDGVAALVLGVAAEAGASGDTIGVITAGIAENVGANGTISAGDIVKRSVTTAGYVAATATPGVGEAIGVAINASTSNTVDVWISKGV